MKKITISVKKRNELGKKSTRELRKIDRVPGVMYGGPEVIHFHAHENDFRHIVYTPNAYIIELDVEGKKHDAVLQELQFHPVSEKLHHIDFVEVFGDKPITMEIPIRLVGDPIGIKNGGRARQRRRVLRVRGLLKHLPDTLDVDITDVDVGETIKIGDLTYDNLEILDPTRSMIYSIVSSRVSMKGMELVEPGEEEEALEAEAAAPEGEEPESEEDAGEEGTEEES